MTATRQALRTGCQPPGAAAPSSLNSRGSDNLIFTVSLPGTADDSQNHNARFNLAFIAGQRAAAAASP
jgi:hypothetical protein